MVLSEWRAVRRLSQLDLALLTVYNDSIETVEQATWKGKRCYRMLLPRQKIPFEQSILSLPFSFPMSA